MKSDILAFDNECREQRNKSGCTWCRIYRLTILSTGRKYFLRKPHFDYISIRIVCTRFMANGLIIMKGFRFKLMHLKYQILDYMLYIPIRAWLL